MAIPATVLIQPSLSVGTAVTGSGYVDPKEANWPWLSDHSFVCRGGIKMKRDIIFIAKFMVMHS